MQRQWRKSKNTYLNEQRSILHHTLAIINIQIPASRPLNTQRRNHTPRIPSGVSSYESRFLRWKYVAAADVDGYVAQRCVDGDVGARGGNVLGRMGIPVVVDFPFASGSGEDAVDGGGALGEDGGNE